MKFIDKTYFRISHQYITDILSPLPKLKQISLYKSLSLFSFSDPIDCEMITRQSIYRGIMYFSNLLIYFKTSSNKKESQFDETKEQYIMCSVTKEIDNTNLKEVIIKVKDINELVRKRFLYIEQAYEIYLRNGKSYFINFYNIQNANKFKDKICKLYNISEKECKVNYTTKKISIINDGATYIKNEQLHLKWKRDKISTYSYLCRLNKYGSRTFNDTNQYYVFPWVIMNYKDFLDWDFNTHDLNKDIRKLKYPPSVQDEGNRTKAREKYALCSYEADDKKVYSYHFGSHYSTSSFIFYYLMRMSPFIENLIKLQNYELEAADRMFTSFTETLKIIINLFDNRELIPEFYSMMEFLLNLNCCYLGRQTNTVLIDDWKLDDLSSKKQFELKDYVHFFYLNNKYLEFIGKFNLNEWIDNIFGCNQLPDGNNIDILNIYPKSTYEQKTNLLKKIDNYYQKHKKEKKKSQKTDKSKKETYPQPAQQ